MRYYNETFGEYIEIILSETILYVKWLHSAVLIKKTQESVELVSNPEETG